MSNKPKPVYSMPDYAGLNAQIAAKEREGTTGAAAPGLNSAGIVSYRQPQRPGNQSPYIPITGPQVIYRPTREQAQSLGGGVTAPPMPQTWIPANIADDKTFFGGGYFTGPAGRAYAGELEAWAKTIHSQSTGGSLWEEAVGQSEWLTEQGQYITPYQLVAQWASDGGGVRDLFSGGSGSSGGGGGYSGGGGGGGTSSTTVYTNKEDARSLINALALKMIGRTVNDSEFETYYQTLRGAEAANPTVVSMAGSGVVQESGLGAAGREEILTDAFRENEDYADYQVGGRMVDMFQQYLSERGVFDG